MEAGGCPFGASQSMRPLPTLSGLSSTDKEVMGSLVPGTQPYHFIMSPLALPFSS